MADYVQYHNTEREGPVRRRGDGRHAIVTHKVDLEHLIGDRVWLIEGNGRPRYYWLHCWFIAEKVEPADPPYSTYIEGAGASFDPPVQLDPLPWFQRLYVAKKLYSLGLQRIENELVQELERLTVDAPPRAVP